MAALAPIRPARRQGLNTTPTIRFPKATATAINKGDVVVLASGLAVADNTDPTAGAVIGVADETVTAAQARAYIHVIPALPHIVFEGNMIGTWAATDPGLKYGIGESSSIGGVEKAETTAVRAVVLRLANPDVEGVGTVNPRIEFIFLLNKTIYDVTTSD